jgi:hypothetical protein
MSLSLLEYLLELESPLIRQETYQSLGHEVASKGVVASVDYRHKNPIVYRE